MNIKFLVIICLLFGLVQAKLLDTSKYLKSRQKRALIWSDNGDNWVQFIFGLGLPLEVQRQAITLGAVFKAFYLLPTNATDYTNPSIDYSRKKRSTSRWMLYEALESLLGRIFKAICGGRGKRVPDPIDMANCLAASVYYQRSRRKAKKEDDERYNDGDGKSCILKSICEISHTPLEQRAGLLSEIVTAVLKPSTTEEELHHHTNMDYFSAEKIGKTEGNCDYFYPECKLDILQQYSRFLK